MAIRKISDAEDSQRVARVSRQINEYLAAQSAAASEPRQARRKSGPSRQSDVEAEPLAA